jgi:hypothetical protein
MKEPQANFILCILASASLACHVAFSGTRAIQPPATPVPAQPTTAEVRFHPISVHGVDFKSESMDIEFYLWFNWKGAYSPRGWDLLNSNSIVRSREDEEADTTGRHYLSNKVRASVIVDLDLRSFPFVDDTARIILEDHNWPVDSMVYSLPQSSSLEGTNLAWNGLEVHYVGSRLNSGDFHPWNKKFSRVEFAFTVSRSSARVTWGVIAPILFFMIVAWLSTWIKPGNLPPQMTVGVGAIINLMAYLLMLENQMPSISYPTLLDYLFLIALVYCTLILLGNIVIHRYYRDTDNEGQATTDWPGVSARCSILIALPVFGGFIYFVAHPQRVLQLLVTLLSR